MEINPITTIDFEVGQDTTGQHAPIFQGEVASLVRSLLAAVGEDPQREGLERTPQRVARMYGELLSGYTTDIDTLVNGAVFDSDYSDMVLVRDIQFYSLCEHHMLPFHGKAHVAYIPDGKIIGLSKIPRLVEMFARRLQVQERMTSQVAEALQSILGTEDVAVVVEGTHLCAAMRGVKNPTSQMVTRVLHGAFKSDRALRSELLEEIK